MFLRHPVIVRTFEGDTVRGFVASSGADGKRQDGADTHCPPFSGETVFASTEGDGKLALQIDRAKVIYLMRDKEDTVEQVVRFFDTAPTPPTLWVRISFRDGEIMEGAIRNAFSSLCAPFLELQPLDHKADRQRIWIPRTSIAELQVITIRE